MKGYVVIHNNHMLELGDGRPEYNGTLLLWGDTGTVFVTYDAARNAIARTARYAARVGYNWDCEQFAIRRVQSA